MSHDSPSYYAIIPANVRYSKEIEMGAKLLYSEITCLTHKEGYCWATNEYFAELYGVNIKTISRWISSLKEGKFIFVDSEKKGFLTVRKIWISEEIKIMFTMGQKCPHGGTKMSTEMDKNVSHNSKKNTKEEKTTPTPSKGDGVCEIFEPLESFGKFVKLERGEYLSLCKEHGDSTVKDLIEQINDYLASSGKKPYKDYAAALRQWLRRRKENPPANSKSTTSETDKELAEKIISKFPRERDIKLGSNYIEFNFGPMNVPHIKFGDKAFREQVIHNLRKMNLSTEGL